MTIWNILPVSEQDAVTLIRWRVMEVDLGAKHLVGYCVENREGRVSSKIIRFDPVTRIAVTASGRKYLLKGAPGVDPDADYVWGNWVCLNWVDVQKDITELYRAQLAAK